MLQGDDSPSPRPRATIAESAVPGAKPRTATVRESAVAGRPAGAATVRESAVAGPLPGTDTARDATAPKRSASPARPTVAESAVRVPEPPDSGSDSRRPARTTGVRTSVQRADQPTLLGGLEPASNAETAGGGRRRPVLERVLPLALLLAFAVVAAVHATLAVVERADGSAPGGAAEGTFGAQQQARLGETIRLPAIQAHIGLSDDNREAVLALCFRISDNPNHECRPSHFEQLGELPARQVPVPALDVLVHEVANQQYDACVAAGACSPRRWDDCAFHSLRGLELGQRVPEAMRAPALPAICVTADEAETFCAHQGMRLPTDVEWERIARHGDDRLQPWGRFWTPALLNWGERDMTGFPIPGRLDGADLTAPVFDYGDGATPAGVLNMLGNVAEWTRRTPRAVDAPPPEPPTAARGGSYVDDIRRLRITREVPLEPNERLSTVGFRCVASAEESP